ncbi:minor capsid protein [Streptococcus suis]|uniref:minor capsid protein n=1 Tax=Streptococcus suis TaxID=1307 RepID=UPI001ABE7448|nr:minor capsid protein [Streptococcus suis]
MKNDYWRKRIEAEQRAKIERDATLADEMKRLYAYHFDALEKEIRAFTDRYSEKNNIPLTEVKKRVSEMDVKAFEEKAKRYVAEKDFSAQANRELSLYNLKMKINRLELLQYQMDLELVALTEGEHSLTSRFLNDEYIRELEFQAGLLGQSVPSANQLKQLAETTLNANFHGANWSDNIWKRQTALRSVVASLTEEYLLRGKNPTTLVSKIRREFDVTSYEARRLAITEGARVATEAQRQSYIDNGYDEYKFMAEPSACAICKPLNGKIFKVSEMIPGETAGPMHPFCRCATAAHYSKSDEEYERILRESWESVHGRESVEKTADKVYNRGMKRSGAVYGAWNVKNDPDEIKRKAHAEQYYESIRNRSTSNEVRRIAKNTGFSEHDVRQIYNHVFENYYELEGGRRRFDPDYDMAQSWERLFSGKDIQSHDLTLLRHELLESKLMAEGLDYDTAHRITQKEHDYLADLIKWQIERGDL